MNDCSVNSFKAENSQTDQRILSSCSKSINERVNRIKNKYGMINIKINDEEKDLQNDQNFLNKSYCTKNQLESTGEYKVKKEKEEIKKQKIGSNNDNITKRIKNLQGISLRINELINDLKEENHNNSRNTIQSSNISRSKILDQSLFSETFQKLRKQKRKKSGSLVTLTNSSYHSLENDKKYKKIDKNSRRKSAPHSTQNITQKNAFTSNRKIGKITQIHKSNCSSWTSHIQIPLTIQSDSQNKKLLKKLCHQVKKDSNLIEAKQRFWKLQQNLQKQVIKILRCKFNKKGKQIHELIKLESDEVDPEFTQRKYQNFDNICCQEMAKQLVDADYQCQKYWNEKVYKKFNYKNINMDYFDFQRKGYVIKEDVARGLAIFSKKLYFNRDVAMIFRRIVGDFTTINRIQKQTFTRCFC